MTTIYPPKNSIIVFREPFPRKEWSIDRVKYYIRTCITLQSGIELPEREIRIAAKQQMAVVDCLLKTDLKLTNAIVKNDKYKRFTIIQHSPQKDFFGLADKKT